jgi:N-acetylglutamate synthase-like GNAT family acetyltransferase
MDDMTVEEHRGDLVISTERARIDVDAVLSMLRVSHWGGGMTRRSLERAIANSVCVGVYDAGGKQLAFARAVTDLATYAYLTDVIVAEDARGKGLGKWMTQLLVAHPDLQGLRRIALWTRNARGLYEQFGFSTDVPPASTYMEIRPGPGARPGAP